MVVDNPGPKRYIVLCVCKLHAWPKHNVIAVSGHAAALTDYLVLRDALCAVTFALSLVALLLVIAAVVLVHVIKKSEAILAAFVYYANIEMRCNTVFVWYSMTGNDLLCP